MTPLQVILLGIVLAPGAVFALFSLLWLLGWDAPERALTRTTAVVYSVATAAVAWLAWSMHAAGLASVAVPLGDWFTVHDYHFPLVLLADRLSLPFLALTVILVGLIGQFSATYLHRDPGFARFYILLHLFAFGALLIFSAGSFDLIIGGWEMVGLTSVLLISFFHYRLGPVDGAMHVFTIYRACDIGLITTPTRRSSPTACRIFPTAMLPSSGCCCCSRRRASRHRFPSPAGSRARWKAPRRRAPFSTAPFRSTPAPICCCGPSRSWWNPPLPPAPWFSSG
jgi:hypothetical protein